MSEDDFEVQMSPLCQSISSGGDVLRIEIYGDGEGKWILEIVDEHNNSTVWDDSFDTDAAALSEARKSILEETASAFVGPKDGKSTGDWE
jgi:hypothetical protein